MNTSPFLIRYQACLNPATRTSVNFAASDQVEGVKPTNHSFSQKTMINDLSYGIKIWADFSSVFVTIHAFDRLTDGRTDGQTDIILITRPRLHSMQRGKATAFDGIGGSRTN